MRRVLIVPSVSTSSVANSESFRELYALTEAISGSGERSFWYMAVPPWVRDGLRGHSNLHYLHVETTRDQKLNDVLGYSAFDLATWFARRGGTHIVDAVITDCVQFAWQLRQFMSDPRREMVPVVVRDLRRRYEGRLDTEPAASVAMSYAVNLVAATSSHNRKEIAKFLSTYLSPTMVRLFNENSFVWPTSADVEALDVCRDNIEKPGAPVAFVGGNVENKGTRFILKVYRKLFALGVSSVVASTSSESSVRRSLPGDDVAYLSDIMANIPLDAYDMEVAKAHLFVSAAPSESVFDEEVRRLVLGQVGVFPHEAFIVDVLGDDYPFYYNAGKEEEALAMASWVSENYDEATGMTEPFRTRVSKRLHQSSVFRGAWEHITGLIDQRYSIHELKDVPEGTAKVPLFNVVYNVANGLGDEFAMRVFLDVLEEHVTYLKPWGRKGTLQVLGQVKAAIPSLYDLRQMLDNLGWIDRCDQSEVVLTRERDPLPGVLLNG